MDILVISENGDDLRRLVTEAGFDNGETRAANGENNPSRKPGIVVLKPRSSDADRLAELMEVKNRFRDSVVICVNPDESKTLREGALSNGADDYIDINWNGWPDELKAKFKIWKAVLEK